jgi:hypothetical protein
MVLTPASLKVMGSPGRLADGTPTRYGTGVVTDDFLGHPRIWQGGGIPGNAASLLAYYPGDGLQIVLLSRTASSPPGAVLEKLADALAGNVLARESMTSWLRGYSGTYTDGKVSLQITAAADGLHVTLPDHSDSKLIAERIGSLEYVLAADPHVVYQFMVVNSIETPLAVIVDGETRERLRLVVPRL